MQPSIQIPVGEILNLLSMRRPKAQPVRKRSGKRTTGMECFLNSESTLESDANPVLETSAEGAKLSG